MCCISFISINSILGGKMLSFGSSNTRLIKRSYSTIGMSLETIEPLGSRGGNTGSKNLSKDIIMIHAIFYVLIVKIAVRRIHIYGLGDQPFRRSIISGL